MQGQFLLVENSTLFCKLRHPASCVDFLNIRCLYKASWLTGLYSVKYGCDNQVVLHIQSSKEQFTQSYISDHEKN